MTCWSMRRLALRDRESLSCSVATVPTSPSRTSAGDQVTDLLRPSGPAHGERSEGLVRASIGRMADSVLDRAFGRYPLAHARPFLDVEGRELIRVVQGRVGLERSLQLVVVRNGQLVLAGPAKQFQTAVGYVDDVVAHIKPDLRTPDVVMNPRTSTMSMTSWVASSLTPVLRMPRWNLWQGSTRGDARRVSTSHGVVAEGREGRCGLIGLQGRPGTRRHGLRHAGAGPTRR